MVVDGLFRMTIESVSHIDENKKDLVKDVYRLALLGVRLEHSLDGGFMVHKTSESSFVVKVKSNQHLDKSLMVFKEMVLDELNEAFSLGEILFKGPRNIVCSQCRSVEG